MLDISISQLLLKGTPKSSYIESSLGSQGKDAILIKIMTTFTQGDRNYFKVPEIMQYQYELDIAESVKV